ncbi:YslB family protein [Fervidibacillus halotolerans]|uniref:YslB family protein n=1 Tax=Fervidibacillus halotolerans TaxID=2980027 RepID=A0A9E8LXN1_9BACI|nr:YslB family protein [Fervidibacillus halotolerans]WAA11618.1 YslB family protein [Fervidibacillus halotolerans]
MKKKEDAEITNISNVSIPAFGYGLIRDELLEDLLGKDGPDILYWAGKRLARKYPLFSMEEVKEFFLNAGWGVLEIKEEKKDEKLFSLSGSSVSYRLQTNTNPSFQLEAGFLAEQFVQQKKVYAECYEHPRKQSGIVNFTVKWDRLPLE